MICFLENTEHWENTEAELASRGVSHSSLDFYSLLQVLFVLLYNVVLCVAR